MGNLNPQYTPVQIPNFGGVVGMALGFDHTCSWNATGQAHCWGKGANYVLGYGGIDDQNSPVQVPGP